MWWTPSAFAICASVTTVGLRVPRSIPLMYCWLKPDRSAISSWVKPEVLRNRAKLLPTTLRMSMRSLWPIERGQFIN